MNRKRPICAAGWPRLPKTGIGPKWLPTTNCRRGDVVLVLFPDSNLRTAKRRPALVVQADELGTDIPQTIVAMITSNTARAGHPSRVMVRLGSEAVAGTGLLMDSAVMADNLATIHYAKAELRKLDRLVKTKRISRSSLELRIKKTLGREYLSRFVVTEIGGDDRQPTLRWHVDAALRRQLEKTRLGLRVLCTDHHLWSTGRIVQAFRGQWNVEELFRRAKKGGVAPWGPSHQWADGSIWLHTFATVLGLMLVSLAKITLGTRDSALAMMGGLAEIRETLVRTTTRGPGRRATVMIAPELSATKRRAVEAFELDRWMPTLLSCMTTRPVRA